MDRMQLARQYAERNANGETFQQLVDEFNRIYRVGKKPRTRGFIQRLISEADTQSIPSNIIHIPKAQVVTRPENIETDKGLWNQELEQVLHDNRFVRVMHMNDMHLPFHDERALELYFKLMYAFQPHVNVMGSDDFDNPTLSRYPADKDISIHDWLIQSETYYKPIVDTVNNIVPKALKPRIFGNHCWRSIEEIGKSSFPVVGLEKYKSIVTYGDVRWLGKTSVVEIGALTVAHGKRFNKYAAAYTSADFNFKPVNAGHTHRPQQMLSCVINGMLCQRTQYYDDNGYPSDHQHGTTLITIDTHTGKVVQVPYLFEESEHQLWTVYNGKPLMSKVIEYSRQGRKVAA